MSTDSTYGTFGIPGSCNTKTIFALNNESDDFLSKEKFVKNLFNENIISQLPFISNQMFDLLCSRYVIDVSKITYKIYRTSSAERSVKLLEIGYRPNDDELVDLVNNCVKIPIFNREKCKIIVEEEKINCKIPEDFIIGLQHLEKILSLIDKKYFENSIFLNKLIGRIINANVALTNIRQKFIDSTGTFKVLDDKQTRIMMLLLDSIELYT